MRNIEQKKTDALNAFKAQHPTSTSGDLQTFVLGMQAMEQIQAEILAQGDDWDIDYPMGDLD